MTKKEIEILMSLKDSLRATCELIEMLTSDLQYDSELDEYVAIIKERIPNNYQSLENAVFDVLTELGINNIRKGYDYLKEAIVIGYKEPESLRCLNDRIYPVIAKNHNTTSSAVERAISFSINADILGNDDVTRVCEILGTNTYKKEGKLTNKYVVVGIIEYIKKTYNF